MTRLMLIVLIGSLSAALSLAQEITGGAEVVHPNQRLEIRGLIAATAKDTELPSVANAAITITLSGSRLKCAPGSEVTSIVEANSDSSLSTLVGKISGTSCAIDGQIRKITATFTPNGAIQANNLIASIKQGQPLIVEWRHSFYVLYGVIYDEHLYPDGRQDNIIRNLLLFDPRYSDKRRFVTFVRGKDDFAEITGTATISAR